MVVEIDSQAVLTTPFDGFQEVAVMKHFFRITTRQRVVFLLTSKQLWARKVRYRGFQWPKMAKVSEHSLGQHRQSQRSPVPSIWFISDVENRDFR